MTIELSPTKVFAVYDVVEWKSDEPHRTVEDYALYGDFNTNTAKKFASTISRFGCCVLKDLVPEESRQAAWKSVKKFVKNLLSHYDPVQDEFTDFDQEENNITRMPRIGRGKHNIHFDPEFSEQHKVLAQLTYDSHFSELLTSYMGNKCTLRESGLTVTRPIYTEENITFTDEQRPGEGMEWHSDGARGEATILLGLENVSPDMGCLRVVPGSHLQYVDGIGHEEAVLKQNHEKLEHFKVNYAYRAGKPIIIDARTLHSVDNNVSNTWRIVNWFIFDSY